MVRSSLYSRSQTVLSNISFQSLGLIVALIMNSKAGGSSNIVSLPFLFLARYVPIHIPSRPQCAL